MPSDAPIDDKARLRVLYTFLGTIEGLHIHLDDLRDHRESPGEQAYNRTPLDHNIEQAQISLEVASMRLQQAVFLIDKENCTPTGPPCTDEGGPCERHA
jgi:hypothetical protein